MTNTNRPRTAARRTLRRAGLALLRLTVLVAVAALALLLAPVEGQASPIPPVGAASQECALHGQDTASDLSCVPTTAGQSVRLGPESCDLIGLPYADHGACWVTSDVFPGYVVAIAAPDDDSQPHPGVELLRSVGFTGEAVDHVSAIYAPVGFVIFDEDGTWTVTLDGLARCEHGPERPCVGSEWI